MECQSMSNSSRQRYLKEAVNGASFFFFSLSVYLPAPTLQLRLSQVARALQTQIRGSSLSIS